MPIKAFFQLFSTVLVFSYPFLVRWILPHWPSMPGMLLMLPPTLLNAWLAWIFGRTLAAGREPMISMFARIERARLENQPEAPLPTELARYTRTLTKLWSGMLLTMAIIATALAVAGWHTSWALFTGLISYLLLGALFFGEYLFRRLHFSQYRHAHPIQMIWFIAKAGPIWARRT